MILDIHTLQETIYLHNRRFEKSSPQDVLQYFLHAYQGRIALASSLGAEDQVLTAMICAIDRNTKIFTLDTGRLFPETYDLLEETNKHFNISIEIYFPDYADVEQMVNEKGINLFYSSVENRKECCRIRKTEPLRRAFTGLDVWICGLRREQSVTRYSSEKVEWDEKNNLIKINPLIDWNEKQVWDYIRQYKIPYNTLHDKNFPSIGCQPCTREVQPGEDIRAGRWWWEQPEHKECGLHSRNLKH